jgi:hypothetical protein
MMLYWKSSAWQCSHAEGVHLPEGKNDSTQHARKVPHKEVKDCTKRCGSLTACQWHQVPWWITIVSGEYLESADASFSVSARAALHAHCTCMAEPT